MFDLEKRKEVLRFIEENCVQKAAEKFKISKKRLMRWIKNGPDRKKGAGRKTLDPEMENILVTWIKKSVKEKGIFPTRLLIKFKAKELCKVTRFRASKGWCDKFFRRNNDILNDMKVISDKKNKIKEAENKLKKLNENLK